MYVERYNCLASEMSTYASKAMADKNSYCMHYIKHSLYVKSNAYSISEMQEKCLVVGKRLDEENHSTVSFQT